MLKFPVSLFNSFLVKTEIYCVYTQGHLGTLYAKIVFISLKMLLLQSWFLAVVSFWNKHSFILKNFCLINPIQFNPVLLHINIFSSDPVDLGEWMPILPWYTQVLASLREQPNMKTQIYYRSNQHTLETYV